MSSNLAIINLNRLQPPSYINAPQIKTRVQFDPISAIVSKLWKSTTCPHTKSINAIKDEAKINTAKKVQDKFEMLYPHQNEQAVLYQNSLLVNKTLNYVEGLSYETSLSPNNYVNKIAEEIYSLQSPVMKNPLVKMWIQAKLSEKMAGLYRINEAATAFAYMHMLNPEHQKISLYVRESDNKAYLVIGDKGTSIVCVPSTGEIYHHQNHSFLYDANRSHVKLISTNLFSPQEFVLKLHQDGLMMDEAMKPFKRLLNKLHQATSLQEKKEIASKICEEISKFYFRQNETTLARYQALSTMHFQMKFLLEPDVCLNTIHSVIDAYFDPLSNK